MEIQVYIHDCISILTNFHSSLFPHTYSQTDRPVHSHCSAVIKSHSFNILIYYTRVLETVVVYTNLALFIK